MCQISLELHWKLVSSKLLQAQLPLMSGSRGHSQSILGKRKRSQEVNIRTVGTALKQTTWSMIVFFLFETQKLVTLKHIFSKITQSEKQKKQKLILFQLQSREINPL